MTAGSPARRGGVPRAAAGLLALLLAGGVQAATAPPAHAAAALGPVFNQPAGTAAQQQAIRTRILGLIQYAAPGSTIKASVYHFWDADLARALVSAHTDRQVDVRIILDESSPTSVPSSTSYGILTDGLGTDRTKTSFAGLCPKGRSCLGDPALGASIDHNKFWAFSDTGGTKDVVLQTSSNISSGSYEKFWNDAMVVSSAGIHQGYSAYFDKLAGMDYAHWSYTYGTSAPYKFYFYPRAGTTDASDTVVGILDNVGCTWSDSAGSHRTQIRVGMFKFTRLGVARKLAALQKAGCRVSVVYSEMDSEASTGSPGTWEELHFAGGPSMRCFNYDDDGDPGTGRQVMHSKFLLISGMYAGDVDDNMWTGSHNFSGPALRKNDEALLKIDTDNVHAAYLQRFTAAQAAAKPGTSDDTALCKGETVQREL